MSAVWDALMLVWRRYNVETCFTFITDIAGAIVNICNIPKGGGISIFYTFALFFHINKTARANPSWFQSLQISRNQICVLLSDLSDWVLACISIISFLARWLTSARAYRIGGRKLCPSVCLYVKRYLLLQFCTDYNQAWINMIWAVAAKTLLCQIFHKWRKIEVNCVYISRCVQLVSYFWNAGMHTK